MDKNINKFYKKEQKEKEQFEKAYLKALSDKNLFPFKIKDNTIFIKRISDNQMKKYKLIWKKEIVEQINNFTLEKLCEAWNEPFCVGIRDYNPVDAIIQYFYHQHGIDLYSKKIKYEIVDKL
jgi:hypothetical protein